MKIIEIAFSGYSVTDLNRARSFYEGVLGLKPSMVYGDNTNGWIEYDIGSSTLSIGNMAPEWKPSKDGGCVGLEVENFDEAMRCLKENGATMLEPFESPVCRMAVVSDPDGNSLLIHKRK
ncbi:MAG TPA: VOC family protein [Candidatus Paceibacterota bacterium]|nr:VOC family protein [Verrucomicrobiota bacterium]HRY48300.1 VOC family protein [Candidatus Paceibacterota bacterium]HSA03835.1 VOC family protein [Candidatus Paceibacterota bacterium]